MNTFHNHVFSFFRKVVNLLNRNRKGAPVPNFPEFKEASCVFQFETEKLQHKQRGVVVPYHSKDKLLIALNAHAFFNEE